MSVSAPLVTKANGLTTVVNTIAAPNEAFETLRTAPTWGWALIVAIILVIAGTYLEGPAARHAAVLQMQQSVNTSSLFANMTPAQKQAAIERAGKPSPFSYVFTVITIFIVVLLNAICMLIANAAGRGQADFKRLWCGSMNIAVPTLALGILVTAVITMLRGADSFNSLIDIVRATPSLAMVVPSNSAGTIAFLSAISVFTIWGFFLNAAMLRVTAKVSPTVAYVAAALVLILGALANAGYFSWAHGMGFA